MAIPNGSRRRVGEHYIGIRTGFGGLRDWYLGDALGLGIMTPCILAVRQREVLTWLKPGNRLEAACLLGLLLLLTVPIFYQSTFPSAIVLTPLLLLILFRLGTSGGALGLLLLAGPAAYFTVRHNGPLASQGGAVLIHGILILQLTLAILTLEVYVIGSALGEMKRVQKALFRAYQHVEQLTGIDPLTQLANRRTLDSKLQEGWETSTRRQECLSFLMIDVDRFKNYNDQFGHIAGDTVLKAISAALHKTASRSSDLTARYGGEEFAIMLLNTDSAGAFLLAEELRQKINALRIKDENGDLPPITVSIGIATAWPQLGQDPTSIIRGADRALYLAKDSGRNKVCVWIEPTDTEQ